MGGAPRLNEEIGAYYAQFRERDRLKSGPGRLEFVRTHLIEPVALLVDQAREDAEREGIALARCDVGDARSLPGAGGSADVVLLLGPPYHLTEREERLTALGEARRVLRPGGLLAAAGISRFAPDLDEWLDDEERRERLLRTIQRVESEPSVIGATGHLVAFGRRPAP